MEIRSEDRGGLVDGGDGVWVGERGGGWGDEKWGGEDWFCVFEDVVVDKVLLFFGVKRVDGGLWGG